MAVELMERDLKKIQRQVREAIVSLGLSQHTQRALQWTYLMELLLDRPTTPTASRLPLALFSNAALST
jgi:hypothetical protein